MRRIFFFLILIFVSFSLVAADYQILHGGIIRGDKTKPEMALVITGGSFADGGEFILKTLKEKNVKASFFFTGDFLRIKEFEPVIQKIVADGHYIAPHSDKHLLLADWDERKNLVTKEVFTKDLLDNIKELERFGVKKEDITCWIPPFEWYSDEHSAWSKELGITLINHTPGTRSSADYLTDDHPRFISANDIFQTIVDYEKKDENGLNGFMLLFHIGTHADRTKDKFYNKLPELIDFLQGKGYELKRVDELLGLKKKTLKKEK